MTSMPIKITIVAVVQLALVGVAVAPQLSARAFGDEYRMRVAPVDPIDPFRGAYVDLGYPDLQLNVNGTTVPDEDRGTIYIKLVPEGDLWMSGGFTRSRPDDGSYLTCDDRDWRVHCGIESWFLPQDKAAAMEDDLLDGAVAVVKIDGRGHAALVAVEAD